jgi:uncharacterized membrane protein
MQLTDSKERLRRYALLSFAGAVSVGVSAVEDFFFLSFPLPGVSAGLNNVVILIFSRMLSVKGLLALQTLKVLLSWILFKGFNLINLFMSASGTLAATVVLVLVLKYLDKGISFAGASSLMAASHITAQLLAASIIVGNSAPLAYAGISGIFSTALGFLSGIIANILFMRLKQISAS